MKKGIIYLIQPAELIGTNRFKISCSTNMNLDRCKSDIRYLCIMECVDPFVLKNKIKTEFNSRYRLIAGYEYYEGDEGDMVGRFCELTFSHNKELSLTTNDHII